MIGNAQIHLASVRHALRIAEMSRYYIESGLGWSWTPARVEREIRSKHSNVIIAVEGREMVGFAIMVYADDEARLNLFAVHPQHRRKGIGTRMLQWLENTALVNGSGVVYLEARQSNLTARRFYEALGYRVVQHIPRYYKGREAAVRMAHDLWAKPTAE
ncbi:MAG: ribosomal protein S18-alanine N-acetyltransferase [Candidatus Thiodiazotropha sp.]